MSFVGKYIGYDQSVLLAQVDVGDQPVGQGNWFKMTVVDEKCYISVICNIHKGVTAGEINKNIVWFF